MFFIKSIFLAFVLAFAGLASAQSSMFYSGWVSDIAYDLTKSSKSVLQAVRFRDGFNSSKLLTCEVNEEKLPMHTCYVTPNQFALAFNIVYKTDGQACDSKTCVRVPKNLETFSKVECLEGDFCPRITSSE